MVSVAQKTGVIVGLDDGAVVKGSARKWEVVQEMGKGGFGVVYRVQQADGDDTDEKTGRRRQYAMKIELNNKHIHSRPTLAMDVSVLRSVGGHEGFVDYVESFTGVRDSSGNPINCLVMGLAWKNMMWLSKRELSPKCVINCADRMLYAIEGLHNAGFVHRDMKPENWAIGVPPDHRNFYLLDLGMCRRFKRKNGQMVALRSRAPGRGTRAYSARAAHADVEQVAMDDVEGWFYTLVELYSRKLPWNDQPLDNIVRYKKALYDKKSRIHKELLDTVPAEWTAILDIIDTRPSNHYVDYGKIHQILEATMDKYPNQHKYDWECKPPLSTYLRLLLFPWWKKPTDVYIKYRHTDHESIVAAEASDGGQGDRKKGDETSK